MRAEVMTLGTPCLLYTSGEQGPQGVQGLQGPAGPAYTAGEGIAISGSAISAKARPWNRNLLDNWYFGAPVNQRGKTVYSGKGLTVDRWQARSAQCYACLLYTSRCV